MRENFVVRDELGRVLCQHGRPFSCDECGEEYVSELNRPAGGAAADALVKSNESTGALWRPIETAPTDGTPIIIARHMEPFGWILGTATYQYLERLGGCWLARGFGTFGELGLAHPTHWMPVPDPPEADQRFCTCHDCPYPDTCSHAARCMFSQVKKFEGGSQ